MYILGYKVTIREIIFSFIIMSVLLVMGFFIGDKISESIYTKNEVYSQALRIEDVELFQHAYNTNAGNAFCKIRVEASQAQTHPDIIGEYMYIERVYEEEHRKSRQVTKEYTDSNGKTHTKTKTEYYWEWDVEKIDKLSSNNVKLNGIEIDLSKVSGISHERLKLTKENVTSNAPGRIGWGGSYIYQGSHKRYSYYMTPKIIDMTGYLRFGIKQLLPATNRSIIELSYETDVNRLYNSHLSGSAGLIAFWIIWVILIIACIIVFVSVDNKWIEDKEDL